MNRSTSLKRSSSLSRTGGLKRNAKLAYGGWADSKVGITRHKPLKRGPVSPASTGQRAWVASEGACRACKRPGKLDPAHVVDRSLGGCDEQLCVVPLCRSCHRQYDGAGGLTRLDLLAVLTWPEQAHAVGHLGAVRALHRLTGVRWVPAIEREANAA